MSKPTDLLAYRAARAERIAAIQVIAADAGPEFAAELLACVRQLGGAGPVSTYPVVIALGWKPGSPSPDLHLTKILAVIAHLVLTGALSANFKALDPVGLWVNARPPRVWLSPAKT